MATNNKPSTSKKMITLKSSDNECFVIEEAVAFQSKTIKNLIEKGCTNNEIPLTDATSNILKKVIEYCEKHVYEENKEELKKWDDEFVKMDEFTILDLVLAANHLNIKSLFDLTCQTVVDSLNGKTAEEIRTMFDIKNDFTPEDEEEMRRGNPWAF